MENLLYHGDKKVKPKSEHASPDINSKEELKMEHIPKKTKKKATSSIESVTTKESSILDDDVH